MTDEGYIRKAIALARKGKGKVNPNPLVGSVIVKNGEIIGKGYHKCFGKEHAEIVALKDAGEKAKGATLYVNLEPCCHHGKTPPCTDAIIKAGIKRVVVGMVDPNPLVNQQGINILREHGIEVVSGVAQEACEELNRVFSKFILTKLPYVTLKIAQSIDGRIATGTGHARWITSEPTRKEAHRIRAESDAIIVGINTVLADNPELTVRLVKGRNPVRIVLDSHLKIPLEINLLSDKDTHQTIIATTSENKRKIERIKETGAHVWQIEKDAGGNVSVPALLKKIGQARMSAVMVEGGARVFTSFIKDKMVDRIVFALAPLVIGKGIEAVGDLGVDIVDHAIRLKNVRTKKVGVDLIYDAEVAFN